MSITGGQLSAALLSETFATLQPLGFTAPEAFLYQQGGFQYTSVGNAQPGTPGAMVKATILLPGSVFNGDAFLSTELQVFPSTAMSPSRYFAAGKFIRSTDLLTLPQTVNRWSDDFNNAVELIISDQGQNAYNVCFHLVGWRLQCNTFNREPFRWQSAYVLDDVGGRIFEYR